MRLGLILFGLFWFTAEPVHAEEAPSFDCAKAISVVEKEICADQDLAALDVALAEAFGQAKVAISEEGAEAQAALLKAQRAWLLQRDLCAKSDKLRACLRDAYIDRTSLLEIAYRLIVPGGYPVERPVKGFDQAPDQIMEAVREIDECDLDFILDDAIYVHDLDLGYELWVVPCWTAAYNFGAAMVTVEYGSLDSAKAVLFEGRPFDGFPATHSLTYPHIDLATGFIDSFHKSRGMADCGTFYRYGWDGQETIRLLELRYKSECDGNRLDFDDYPLIYQAW